MAFRKMFSKGCLGTKRLGKENRGHRRITVGFQIYISRGFILHTAGPAIDMGTVREQGQEREITGRYAPEAGSRY